MCLAIPARVLELVGDDALTRSARVAFAGIVKEVSVALLPDACVDDYVIVHAGFAIAIIDQVDAARTLARIDALDAFELSS